MPDDANQRKRAMVIAIDGPAASGKGTLAKLLAAHYGLRHLDTGALYRAVALGAILRNVAAEDVAAVAGIARRLDIGSIDDRDLRTAEVGAFAAVVAAMPEVRACLVEFQRRFAARPPGAVIEGRDIGTVVCPDADIKLFVLADLEVRAHRRFLELRAAGSGLSEEQVSTELAERDRRDQTRAISPLLPARDAHLLDTSKMSIEAMFQDAVTLIDGT